MNTENRKWETVKNIFTPGGDPLYMCPVCKSKESWHINGIECRCKLEYCPSCKTKLDYPLKNS